MPPLVSIVSPSLNQGAFLERTIKSVLLQDYPNFEYIIIDGGSTDGSVDIIKHYSDRISYWSTAKDDGQADAINTGFKLAKGKYLAWLNSDDLYLQGCVRTAVEALEANPEAGMVFGQVDVVDSHGLRVGAFRPIRYRFEDLLTYNNIIPQQAAFFRRDVLNDVGMLDLHFHYALDHEFFLRVGTRFPILSIPQTLAQYRISEHNKGAAMRSSWAKEFISVLDKFFYQPRERDRFRNIIPAAYAGAYFRGAGNLLDDGCYSLARQWYIISARRRLNYTLRIRWWIGFIRTFLGGRGNKWYFNLKIQLARRGWLDKTYDWWVALRIAKEENDNYH